jgi:hypothetical protein
MLVIVSKGVNDPCRRGTMNPLAMKQECGLIFPLLKVLTTHFFPVILIYSYNLSLPMLSRYLVHDFYPHLAIIFC